MILYLWFECDNTYAHVIVYLSFKLSHLKNYRNHTLHHPFTLAYGLDILVIDTNGQNDDGLNVHANALIYHVSYHTHITIIHSHAYGLNI